MTTGLPEWDEAHAPPVREQILLAARDTIEDWGPGALTGQIAERAGLARPNVYRHFSSKSDLDRAVARSAYQELRAEIERRLDQSGTPLDVIRAPIAAQVTWAGSHPNLYRFIASYGYQQRSEQPRGGGQFAATLTEAGARYFPRFTEDPEAAEATNVAIRGFLDASILHWLARRTETPDQVVDRLTTWAWLLIDHHLGEFGVHIDPAVPLQQPRETRS